MNVLRFRLVGSTVVFGLALAAILWVVPSQAEQTQASKDGERACTKCHDESESTPVLSILKTKHAVTADERTPFADRSCMTCHGESLDHRTKKSADGETRMPPDIVFSAKGATPVAKKNEVCLDCHEQGVRLHWKGSKHDFEGLACTSCHTVHSGHDPVLDKVTQTDVCFTCHQNRRAEIHMPSTHPIREGKVSCSDCHNPHGSNGPALLTKATVNDTCYTCHAEKRGPFLWEHQPVREDCTICHKPHGSVNASLLKTRVPWLCQSCHLESQHPSTAYSGTGLPTSAIPSGARQVMVKGCNNCHSQVHGSNHPSGPRWTR